MIVASGVPTHTGRASAAADPVIGPATTAMDTTAAVRNVRMRDRTGMGVDIQGESAGDNSTNERAAPKSRSTRPVPRASSPTDAELADGTTAGDAQAVAGLYRRYATDVAAVCRSRGPAGETDDLVHEAFAALLSRSVPLTDPDNVRGWLLRTARNLAIDATRAHRNSHTQHLHDDASETASTASVESGAIDRIVVQGLLAEFADDRDAQLLNDHLLLDTPLRTLAARAGTTYGAIKVRSHRARKRLAELADANGIRAVFPLPLTWLADRVSRFLKADISTAGVLLPIAVAIGVAAPTADARPGTGPPTPVENAFGRALPAGREALDAVGERAGAPGASFGSGPAVNGSQGTDDVADPTHAPNVRPALVESDPVRMPAGTGQISTGTDAPAQYEMGIDSGLKLRGHSIGVTVSFHDEPLFDPAAGPACDAAAATPATYCEQDA